MKTILLAGSNRSKSINQQLIEYMAQSIDDAEVLNMHNYDAPMYSIDLEYTQGIPKTIKKLNEKLSDADTVVMALPEHNGNFTAFFKNIIDWLSRENRGFLANKNVLLVSATPGPNGGMSVLNIAEQMLPFFGGRTIGKLRVNNFYQVFLNGKVIDKELENELNAALNNGSILI
ncbi:NADPH-dependent FMN reductase [Aquimarina mytili]|uniref:NAD(P)H-dependent oxidoreductase n=1 Tax=Aquimarina mytili TaxID=874423 RepID=A0A936ZVF3_9FLAO|nr:NAD(P)H-dependent oxidoreductase [Aquimarina mytili]MBL0682926.1 NAD(P)H-dependent oxidoreductase [Aquimarina mytili]